MSRDSSANHGSTNKADTKPVSPYKEQFQKDKQKIIDNFVDHLTCKPTICNIIHNKSIGKSCRRDATFAKKSFFVKS